MRPPSIRPPSMRPPRLATRLSATDFDLVGAARRIVESALGLVRGENLLVVVDRARKNIGVALEEVALTLGATATILELEELGERPMRRLPEVLHAAMRAAQASVLLVGFDDAEVGLRAEIVARVRALNLRHADMMGVTRLSIASGFSVDPSRILDTTRAVRQRLRPDSKLRLRSPGGSDLEVQLAPHHRWAEHVGVIRPGRWESLPSGQLVAAPTDIRGVFVADASIGGALGAAEGLLARYPVRFEIDGGVCKSVRVADLTLQRSINELLRCEHNLDRVGSVAIGTNVGILAPVGEITCDQNQPGLHLTFGSSFPEVTGSTWSTRAQLTVTCASADVDLDGAPLLRSGRYMIG